MTNIFLKFKYYLIWKQWIRMFRLNKNEIHNYVIEMASITWRSYAMITLS